jgi:hypothetical protein
MPAPFLLPSLRDYPHDALRPYCVLSCVAAGRRNGWGRAGVVANHRPTEASSAVAKRRSVPCLDEYGPQLWESAPCPIVLVPRPRPRNRLSFCSEPLRQARRMKSRGRARRTRTSTIKEPERVTIAGGHTLRCRPSSP